MSLRIGHNVVDQCFWIGRLTNLAAKICDQCGKRKSTNDLASFTGWIFQENRCTCGRTTRTKLLASATQMRLVAGSHSQSTAPAPLIVLPQEFGDRYDSCETIGSGGMGVVYKVYDKELNKSFAIKVLRPEFVADRMIVKRFEQETKTIAMLNHPNLAAIYGQGKAANGAPYLVMDLVSGSSLADILQIEYCLDTPTAMDVFCQISEAMAYAHGKGVIHRDLKPSNILISSETGLVKLVDFGIAKVLPTNEQGKVDLTQTGEIFGSPLYMSPEQCQGDALDVRSDIYSFGCVMYEAVCGVTPFTGANPVKIILAHLNEQAKNPAQQAPMAKIPDSLVSIIVHCLEKEPNKRYQSMSDLNADLCAVSEGREPINIMNTVSKKRVNKRLLIGAAALTGLALVLGSMIVLRLSPPMANSTARPLASASSTAVRELMDVPGGPMPSIRDVAKHSLASHMNERSVVIADVTDKDLEAFDNSTKTESVSILNSQLQGAGLAHLIHLPLVNLSLKRTDITERGLSEIQHMTNLRCINLDETGITDSGLAQIGKLKDLQYLFLANNSITAAGINNISGLSKLRSLNLTRNLHVTQTMLQHLSKFNGLLDLSLVDSNVTDSDLAELKHFKSLRRLYLTGTKISDVGVHQLKSLKTLKVVDLNECPNVTESGLRALARALPGLALGGGGRRINSATVDLTN